MLRIDFYESGIGETTIITFPKGGIGIVDAHPSPSKSRQAILELVKDREIHFLCLTHPHADHGKDLVPILENGPRPKVLWHTIPNFKEFIYYATEFTTFPSPNAKFIEKYNSEWAECFLDMFAAAKTKKIPRKQLRADIQPEEIDGVTVHFLSPEENISTAFAENYAKQIQSAEPKGGDPNLLSAVLALHYAGQVILLGADALKRNWRDAVPRYKKAGLPKAILLKTPHHGAKNACVIRKGSSKRQDGYLDLISANPKPTTIIFAGDVDHPNPDVYEKLSKISNVSCLANGLKSKKRRAAGILRPAEQAHVCQGHLSFTLDEMGTLTKTVGTHCQACV